MDPHRRLARDIASLTWQEFQRLVHDLVKKERPSALPLEAPDGGADTLIPAEGADRKEVVQAKHYPRPGKVKWSQCRASLEAAVEHHEPSRITFVLSRDFTAKDERDFREQLVEPYAQVEVRPWTLADVIERLERYPELKKRYFGREHADVIDSVLRAVELRGKLETGTDLIDRARSLAVFADEHDRDFVYSTAEGAATLPEPRWDVLPFMAMTVKDETTSVRVDAWTREGADVPPAAFGFTADEAGRAALAHAREELASGREAIVRSGVRLTIPTVPRVMKEVLKGGELGSPEVTIRPGLPVALEVEIETDAETIKRTFDVRPVPPLEVGHAALASAEDGLYIELDFCAREEPTVDFSFRLRGRFREDVATNVDAARLLHTFFAHRRIILRAEHLFPGGELDGRFDVGTEAERRSIAFRREVYEALALIEGRTGIDFTLPERFGEKDLVAIMTVANILKTGEGTATFETATGIVEANEIPWITERFRQQRVIRRPVVYDVLGESVNLGLGEYELPQLRVIDVRPLGMTPDAPAHVTVGAAEDDQMRFRLVEPARHAA